MNPALVSRHAPIMVLHEVNETTVAMSNIHFIMLYNLEFDVSEKGLPSFDQIFSFCFDRGVSSKTVDSNALIIKFR